MSTETQPSEHAMRAAAALDTNLYLSAEARQCALRNAARAIDQHAIAPAVAERDRRIAELEQKANQFVKQLERVHRDPRYMAVWEHAQNSVSLGRYTGPTYVDELKELVSALAKHGGAYFSLSTTPTRSWSRWLGRLAMIRETGKALGIATRPRMLRRVTSWMPAPPCAPSACR